MTRLFLLLIVVGILAGFASGQVLADENWPMWRGADGTGMAGEGSNPPVTWSESENIKWKVKVPGNSLSTPVVWGDKLIYLTAIGEQGDSAPAPSTEARPAAPRQRPEPGSDRGPRGAGGDRPTQSQRGDRRPGGTGGRGPGGRGGTRGPGGRGPGGGGSPMSQAPSGSYKFDIVCIDRNNGKTIWQRTVKEELPHEGHHRDNSFASYSPVTDGKFIWASFGSRGVYCYDMQGNQKWCKDLGPMKTRAGFGEGTSPCLAGNALIVVMDQENQSNIYALNKNTGDIIWQKKRDELTSWSTPVPVEVDGKLQVISSASNFIRSYDAKTGNIVWQCSGQTANVIPTPVIGFDMVICMSGYRGNAVQAIKLNAKGDVSGTDAIVWEVDDGTPYVPSPLLYGDKLYFGSSNRAIISCYNAKTGKPHFVEQDLDEMSGLYASPVGAADRVYIAGRGGMTTVIKNSDKFEPLATNKLDDNFDASPVIIGDNIYLKGKANIYCIAKP